MPKRRKPQYTGVFDGALPPRLIRKLPEDAGLQAALWAPTMSSVTTGQRTISLSGLRLNARLGILDFEREAAEEMASFRRAEEATAPAAGQASKSYAKMFFANIKRHFFLKTLHRKNCSAYGQNCFFFIFS